MLKNKRRIMPFLLIILMILSLFPSLGRGSIVYAEDSVDEITVPVTVRIEGNDRTIVPRMELDVINISLEDYGYPNVKYKNGPYTIHAIIQALEASGKDPRDKEVFYASWGGGFIETVDGISMSSYKDGWMYRINNKYVSVGVNASLLEEGYDIVLYYVEDYVDTQYSYFDIQELEVEKGEKVSLVLISQENFTSKEKPVSNAQILVNDNPFEIDEEKVVTDADGKAVLCFDSEGVYHISAERFNDNGVRNISRPYCKIVVTDGENLEEHNKSEDSQDLDKVDDLERLQTSEVNKLIEKTYDYYRKNKTALTSWWEIVALFSAGEDVSKSPWILPEWNSSALDEDGPAIYHTGYILGLMAQGKDPTNIWGRNLVSELRAKQEPSGTFGIINSHIWSIITLDAADAEYDVEGAINHLIRQQKNDGGYAWGNDDTPDESGDPDMTGMGLVALANHRDIEGVDEAIEKALNYLKESQLETGGFASWGSDNVNSVATVISGLVAVGEDVLSEPWTKDGNTMLDALRRFMLDDGSFSFMLEPKESNDMATYQAFIALNDLRNEKTIWHNLSISSEEPIEEDIEELPKEDKMDNEEFKEKEELKKQISKDIEKIGDTDRVNTKNGYGEDIEDLKENINIPKTGDNGISYYIILAIVSMSIVLYIFLSKKMAKQR